MSWTPTAICASPRGCGKTISRGAGATTASGCGGTSRPGTTSVWSRIAWPPTVASSGSATPANPSTTSGAAPGKLLFSDALDDLATGRLPRSSSQPSNFILAYSSDGYLLQKVNPSFLGLVSVAVPGPAGTFDDAVIAVDAKVIDPTPNRFAALSCRDQSTANSGYRLTVAPASGQVAISRVDAGTSVPLVSPVDATALLRNQVTNRIELSCVGPSISGRINGTEVAAAQDGAYRQGGLLIAAGADANRHHHRVKTVQGTQEVHNTTGTTP